MQFFFLDIIIQKYNNTTHVTVSEKIDGTMTSKLHFDYNYEHNNYEF